MTSITNNTSSSLTRGNRYSSNPPSSIMSLSSDGVRVGGTSSSRSGLYQPGTHQQPPPPSCSSINLVIRPMDAQRMVEASASLNHIYQQLLSQRHDDDEDDVINDDDIQEEEEEDQRNRLPNKARNTKKSLSNDDDDYNEENSGDENNKMKTDYHDNNDEGDDDDNDNEGEQPDDELLLNDIDEIEMSDDNHDLHSSRLFPQSDTTNTKQKKSNLKSSSFQKKKSKKFHCYKNKNQDENEDSILIMAAQKCTHPLVQSFYQQLLSSSDSLLLKSTNISEKKKQLEVSLVLFLKMDKSTKLITAFSILCNDNSGNNDAKLKRGGGGEKGINASPLLSSSTKHQDGTEGERKKSDLQKDAASPSSSPINFITSPSSTYSSPANARCGNNNDEKDDGDEEEEDNAQITPTSMKLLFQSFLTAISMCISSNRQNEGIAIKKENDEENSDTKQKSKSPSSSANNHCQSLSEKTKQEIHGIALHASEELVRHAKEARINDVSQNDKNARIPTLPNGKDSDNILLSFETFGEWYNLGGFKLVPWLELLDLAKWDYAGRSLITSGGAADSESQRQKKNNHTFHHQLPPPLVLPAISEDGSKGGAGSATTATAAALSRSVRMKNDLNQSSPANSTSISPPPSARAITSMMRSSSSSLSPTITPSSGLNANRCVVSFDFTGACSSEATKTSKNDNSPNKEDGHGNSSPGSESSSSSSSSFGNEQRRGESKNLKSKNRPLNVNITEENLNMLKTVVTRTGLYNKTPSEVVDVILRHATIISHPSSSSTNDMAASPAFPSPASASSLPSPSSSSSTSPPSKRGDNTNRSSMMILTKDNFGSCMRELVGHMAACTLSEEELIGFSTFLVGLFHCFDRENQDVVNAKELAAGFSFLCGGNKSSKLAVAFRLLDENRDGYLTPEGLTRFLRSYLTVIVGISMSTSKLSRSDMFRAVDNGANWTQSHIFSSYRAKGKDQTNLAFEDFASWYTEGGYNVAPWLELLDLNKFISLLDDSNAQHHHNTNRNINQTCFNGKNTTSNTDSSSRGSFAGGRGHSAHQESPRVNQHHHPVSQGARAMGSVRKNGPMVLTPRPAPSAPKEILFSFPLANDHNLVILKEDVYYVRSVVDQLILPMINPDSLWASLSKQAGTTSQHAPSNFGGTSSGGTTGYVDQNTFVRAMEVSIYNFTGRKVDSGVKNTLANFFSSYDLDQVHRVQLTQLMGGITLLCSGRKSAKLAFSFGLFDGRSGATAAGMGHQYHDASKQGEAAPALNSEELFLFLRSFLIVLFSCCAQSLELSAEVVSQWINGTSKMVCENVMRYQWNSGKRSVNFDDFGVWYNQGGFEIAPWLELLDLTKWVLDQTSQPNPQNAPNMNGQPSCMPTPSDSDLQPMMDGDFPLDDFAGLDHIMMPDYDKLGGGPTTPSNLSPGDMTSLNNNDDSSSLTFQLLTNEDHGGYLVAVSQERVALLRQLVTESGLYNMEPSQVCTRFLEHADKATKTLTKDRYDCAIRSIVASSVGPKALTSETQQNLSSVLTSVFYAFDKGKTQRVDAIALASGFSVLCGGRKSDKLEYSFDLIDEDRDGKLSRQGLCKYLRSFLTVLLSICSAETAMNEDRIESAINSGATWVAGHVFGGQDSINNTSLIAFDDFAAWYTKGGYGIIPWLELLDLKKWVITS